MPRATRWPASSSATARASRRVPQGDLVGGRDAPRRLDVLPVPARATCTSAAPAHHRRPHDGRLRRARRHPGGERRSVERPGAGGRRAPGADRQRRPCRLRRAIAGRDGAGHRLRPDRPHGRRRSPRPPAPRSSSPPTPSRTASSWPARWAPTSRSTRATTSTEERLRAATDGNGVDVVLEMSGVGGGAPPGPRGVITNGGRDRLLGTHARPATLDLSEHVIFKGLRVSRHHRPADVRHVVPDDGAARGGPRRVADHHPPPAAGRLAARPSTWSPPATPARSCCCHRRRRCAMNDRRPRTRATPWPSWTPRSTSSRRRSSTGRCASMTSTQTPLHDDRRARPVISLSSQQLPRASPPIPSSSRRRSTPSRDLGVGIRRGAHDRRHDGAARGARAAAGDVQARRGGRSTFQSGFTANTGVIPTITTERDLIVSDELNHASIIDGVRLSKASAGRLPARATSTALAARPQRGPRAGGRTARTARSSSSPTASSAWTATSRRCRDICDVAETLRGGRHGRRRARVRRARSQRARHGRPLRPPRPGRHPGRHAVQGDRRAGRLRRRAPAPADCPRPALAPVPLLDLASAGRRGRLPGRHRRARDRAGADRAAVGEHPFFKAGLERLGFDTGISETPDHAGHRRCRGAGASVQRPPVRARASSRWASASRRCHRRSAGSGRS